MGALSHLPATFGHESAGVVADRGHDVTDVDVGDLVVVKPMYLHPCLRCDACRAGFTNGCAELGVWHGRHRVLQGSRTGHGTLSDAAADSRSTRREHPVAVGLPHVA